MVLFGLTGVGKLQKKNVRGFIEGGSLGGCVEAGRWSWVSLLQGSRLFHMRIAKGSVTSHLRIAKGSVTSHPSVDSQALLLKKKRKNKKTLPMTPLIVTNGSSRGSISAQRRIAFNVSKWKVQLKASESALLIPIAGICFSSYISIWRLRKGFLQVATT